MKRIHEFKHKFELPKKDFSDVEDVELTVHQDLTEKDEYGNEFIHFWATIPKYLYEKVVDTEEQYLIERSEDFFAREKDSFNKPKFVRFKNIVKSTEFLDIVRELKKITKDAIQVQLVQDSEKIKVICVRFTKSEIKQIDSWHHAKMGLKIDFSFQWFVAYKRKSKEWQGTRTVYEGLGQDTHGLQGQRKGYGFKQILGGVVEKDFNVIKWTEEREAFFTHIEKQFMKLNKQLEEFLGNITDKKVKELMLKYRKGFFLPAPEEKK